VNEPAYCIGVDFGTESGRARLLHALKRIRTGKEEGP
jgi:ribulose kinase